ncbi:response regulator transcription factor [Microbispora amethystogenes]|uniref:HTH luxR-type domain-containing protein n=1 Tax=Microbispora amethystogenes TaxID=1427754 RepID=A0ABQ4FAZ8_9ACTN|nr:LuxR C-terminal-related transcriptional regulator [Microbispora amethystogenes]GIH31975.1 hypothetical protein Mam01_21390 [Microbispora amethystogenes]
MAHGRSNAEIAERLHMSVATVKANITRIFAKPDADNRVQVAMKVRDAGLLCARPPNAPRPHVCRRSRTLGSRREARPADGADLPAGPVAEGIITGEAPRSLSLWMIWISPTPRTWLGR